MARKPKNEPESDSPEEAKPVVDNASRELRYRRISAYSTLAIAVLLVLNLAASIATSVFAPAPLQSSNNSQLELVASATRDQNVLLLRILGSLDSIRENTE